MEILTSQLAADGAKDHSMQVLRRAVQVSYCVMDDCVMVMGDCVMVMGDCVMGDCVMVIV